MKPIYFYLLMNVCIVGWTTYYTWSRPLWFGFTVLTVSAVFLNTVLYLSLKARAKRKALLKD